MVAQQVEEKKLKQKKYLRWLGTLLIVAGIVALLYPFFTNFYTAYEQRKLEEKWAKKQAEIRAEQLKSKKKKQKKAQEEEQKRKQEDAYYAQIGEGATFGKIVIPKIGVEAVCLEGTSLVTLRYGPGHMVKTGFPGRVGNCYVAGHRTTWGAPFRNIDKLRAGDAIYFHTPYNKYTYIVSEVKTVKPTDWSVTYPTPDTTLTLQACHPIGSAAQRLIVVAKLKK